MDKIENKKRIRAITINGIMLSITVAIQAANLPNIVTGVIVNAIFAFILFYIGIKSALTLGFLSPLFGFVTGHLPAIMYPVLPIIAIGNCFLILVLSNLKNSSTWAKILLPSFIKALIIGLGGKLMVHLFVPDKIHDFWIFSVLEIQFFTAMLGIWLGLKLRNDVIK